MKKIFISIVCSIAIMGLMLSISPVLAANDWSGDCTEAQINDPNHPCNPDFTGGTESSIWGMMQGGGINAIGQQAYGVDPRKVDLKEQVMYLVQGFLSVLGIIFLIIIVYSGFRWMMAGGNQDQVSEAKKWIRNSIIGLAIIISAYGITLFVTA